jgi:hypothetical protein
MPTANCITHQNRCWQSCRLMPPSWTEAGTRKTPAAPLGVCDRLSNSGPSCGGCGSRTMALMQLRWDSSPTYKHHDTPSKPVCQIGLLQTYEDFQSAVVQLAERRVLDPEVGGSIPPRRASPGGCCITIPIPAGFSNSAGRCGGIGIHRRLKISRLTSHAGSNPATATWERNSIGRVADF